MIKLNSKNKTAVMWDGSLLRVAECVLPRKHRSGTSKYYTLAENELAEHAGKIRECVLVIPGSAAFSFVAEIPTEDEEELVRIRDFEIRRQLPLEGIPVITGHLLLEQATPGTTRILALAVPQGSVTSAIKRLEPLGCRVTEVEISFLGLLKCQSILQPGGQDESKVLAVEVGDSFMDVILIENNCYVAHRSINISSSNYREECRNFLKYFGYESEYHLENAQLSGVAETVGVEEVQDSEPGYEFKSLFGAVLPATGYPDFRPESLKKKEILFRHIAGFAKLAAAVILCLLLLVGLNDMLYWHTAQHVEFLNQRLRDMGDQGDELARMMEQINESETIVSKQNYFLSLLDDLSKAAPEEVFIDYFSLESKDTVRIGGQAPNREALFEFVKAVEKIKGISSVRPAMMPARTMGGKDIIDYQLDLRRRTSR